MGGVRVDYDAADKAKTDSASDLKTGNKLVDEMEGSIANFKKASASYATVLEKVIDKEIDKRTEPAAKTAYERAVKYLKKELASVGETGASRVVSYRQRFNAAEKDRSTKEKMQKELAEQHEGGTGERCRRRGQGEGKANCRDLQFDFSDGRPRHQHAVGTRQGSQWISRGPRRPHQSPPPLCQSGRKGTRDTASGRNATAGH